MMYCTAALAVDGRVEINQVCVVNGGCFEGDSEGFPLTINGNAGNSYILTSNLVVPDENTNGIEIQVSDISLNLNGFSIIRAGCGLDRDSCRPTAGSGIGIAESRPIGVIFISGITIENGSVIGMGYAGIYFVAHQSKVQNVNVRWNRHIGISLGGSCIITGNTAFQNGWGIGGGDSCVITDNTSKDNDGVGINAGTGSMVRGNATNTNDGDIQVYGSGLVIDNTVVVCNQWGMQLGAEVGYRGNTISLACLPVPYTPIVGGVNLGGNLCGTSTTCQ